MNLFLLCSLEADRFRYSSIWLRGPLLRLRMYAHAANEAYTSDLFCMNGNAADVLFVFFSPSWVSSVGLCYKNRRLFWYIIRLHDAESNTTDGDVISHINPKDKRTVLKYTIPTYTK